MNDDSRLDILDVEMAYKNHLKVDAKQIKKEYLEDLATIRGKCQSVIDERRKDESPKFAPEWFMLHEIVGYCNGATRRVNDFY